MPNGHAKLSPSTASRWLRCPGSVHLSSKALDTGSSAAHEGTAGHHIFEIAMRAAAVGVGLPAVLAVVKDCIGQKVKVDISENAHVEIEITAEMAGWVMEAVEWVLAYLDRNPGSFIFSEQEVDIGLCFGLPVTEDGKTVLWGTSDLFIVSPRQGRLVVADLKLGYGEVSAYGNDQLRMYALGLLNEWYWACCDEVQIVILQPRNGGAKDATITAEALVEWGNEQGPKVHAALEPTSPRVPSDEACQWCRGAPACPELKAQSVDLARTEFSAIDTLTVEDLAEVLNRADLIRTALRHYEDHAKRLLSLGHTVPGWKRVKSRCHRVWKDEAGARSAMTALGYGEGDYCKPASLITPAQAEKLVGKKDLLTDFIMTPEGEPTLVAESDRRAALPGDFNDMQEAIP